MVHRGQTAFTVVFKHREVDHPQRTPAVQVSQKVQVTAGFQTQRAHCIGFHGAFRTRAEENDVAGLCVSSLQNGFNGFLRSGI